MSLLRTAALFLLLVTIQPPAMAAADYDLLEGALQRHVQQGVVDYPGLAVDPAFRQFIEQLGRARSLPTEDRAARLAFLINAYNALTLHAILQGESIGSAAARRRLLNSTHELMGEPVTLAGIEAELESLAEPRAWFALACAAVTCPRLSSRSFRPEQLDRQLDEAARRFTQDRSRNRLQPARRLALLAPLWAERRAVFEAEAGSLPVYIALWVDDRRLAESLRQEDWSLEFPPHEWLLNGFPPR